MNLKIANHSFSLVLPDRYESFLGAYRPFLCDEDNGRVLYEVSVVQKLGCEIIETLIETPEPCAEGEVKVNIYQTKDGLLYDIFMYRSIHPDARLHIYDSRAEIEISSSRDNDFYALSAFNNAMILSFVNFTLEHNTLLLHSSAVMKDNKVFLFLGKSGTGKSTHARMWLENFDDAQLLNDDHPIIRLSEGQLIAYGSPWSGKTPCYRNLSAPVEAICRLRQAPYNKLTLLTTLQGYASVTTSCSGAQWSKKLSEFKSRSLENIITSVRCYQLECLADKSAAHCCYYGICEQG